jgi:hypothetical protein
MLVSEIMEILHTTGIHKQVGDPKKARKKVQPFAPQKTIVEKTGIPKSLGGCQNSSKF